MSDTLDDEKNFAQVGRAVLYNYGWLCFIEWYYFEDQGEQPDSKWSHQALHRSMQHYLFA